MERPSSLSASAFIKGRQGWLGPVFVVLMLVGCSAATTLTSDPTTRSVSPASSVKLVRSTPPPQWAPSVIVSTKTSSVPGLRVYDDWVTQSGVMQWHIPGEVSWPALPAVKSVIVTFETRSLPLNITLLIFSAVDGNGIPLGDPEPVSCLDNGTALGRCKITQAGLTGAITLNMASLLPPSFVIVDGRWFVPSESRPSPSSPAADSASWVFRVG